MAGIVGDRAITWYGPRGEAVATSELGMYLLEQAATHPGATLGISRTASRLLNRVGVPNPAVRPSTVVLGPVAVAIVDTDDNDDMIMIETADGLQAGQRQISYDYFAGGLGRLDQATYAALRRSGHPANIAQEAVGLLGA